MLLAGIMSCRRRIALVIVRLQGYITGGAQETDRSNGGTVGLVFRESGQLVTRFGVATKFPGTRVS